MAGITLDTGALIGFERAARRTMAQLKLAEQFGYELTVPPPVIVEASGHTARRSLHYGTPWSRVCAPG